MPTDLTVFLYIFLVPRIESSGLIGIEMNEWIEMNA